MLPFIFEGPLSAKRRMVLPPSPGWYFPGDGFPLAFVKPKQAIPIAKGGQLLHGAQWEGSKGEF